MYGKCGHIKKDTIFKDFLTLNIHQNANRKLSSNNFQKLAKAYKMGICELVFWALVLKWYYELDNFVYIVRHGFY